MNSTNKYIVIGNYPASYHVINVKGHGNYKIEFNDFWVVWIDCLPAPPPVDTLGD